MHENNIVPDYIPTPKEMREIKELIKAFNKKRGLNYRFNGTGKGMSKKLTERKKTKDDPDNSKS